MVGEWEMRVQLKWTEGLPYRKSEARPRPKSVFLSRLKSPPSSIIMEPDWSNLPKDILEAVSNKIASPTDYLRLRAVCTPWRSALSPSPGHLQPLLPWLLLPYDPNFKEGKDAALRFFYDMSNFQIRRIYLPQTCGKQYCGSSKGCLLLQHGPEMSLFNPITKVQIQLPSLNVVPTVWGGSLGVESDDLESRIDIWPSRYGYKEDTDPIVQKFVLTSSPSLDHDCIVMALFKSNWGLAFCRIGDESWTLFEAPADNGARWSGSRLIDTTYHNGLFYCFSYDEVKVYDLKDTTCKVLKMIVPLEHTEYHLMEEEVEELLLVAQHRAPHGIRKRDVFSIYKLGIKEEESVLYAIKTKGIGEKMCFICEGIEGIEQCFTFPITALQMSVLPANSLCYACPHIVQKNREDFWGWHPEEKFGYDIKIVRLPLEEVPIFSNYWKDCVTELVKSLGSYPTEYSRASWVTPSFC